MLKTIFVCVILAVFLISNVEFVNAQRNRRVNKQSRQVLKQCKVIMPQSFSVGRGKDRTFPIKLSKAYFGGTLSGQFRVRGGSGNDIMVWILDQDSYESIDSGHRFEALYNSKGASIDTINLSVGSGKNYYLIFFAEPEFIGNKLITSNITLCYKYYK